MSFKTGPKNLGPVLFLAFENSRAPALTKGDWEIKRPRESGA